jgi:carboxyl-terminal processing protease
MQQKLFNKNNNITYNNYVNQRIIIITMRKIFYLIILLSTVIVSSCKKSKTVTPDEGGVTGPSKTGSALDLMRDSVYLYAQETYYWNDAIPAYADFQPRAVTGTDDITTLENEVDKISQLKINPTTGKPYEYYSAAPGHAKYSFIDDGSVSSELNGVKGDFGFAPIWISTSDLRIRYVYPGSPVDLAGVKRGYQIIAVNGRTNLDYDGNGGAGTTVNYVINAYSNSSTITMTLRRPDATTFDVTLNVATYTLNPVLISKVFDQGNGHKVGYIVFNSFTSDANAKPKLDAAFANFAAQNITDLVVDLRYNGGGYVSTAEYLTNLIAPASATGQVMYNTFFNTKLASLTDATRKTSILTNQVRRDESNNQLYNYGQFDYTVAGNVVNFSKTGISTNLTLGNIFFIVTGSTASASELTINNLRGVMPTAVKLIGTTSYGKPVGFFNININKYQMYIPQFETKNQKDQGGYYAGMTPGTSEYPGVVDGDDVSKDFGDPTERLLAHALKFVTTGTYNMPTQQIQSLSKSTFSVDQSREAAIEVDNNKFNGMIFNKKLKLK